MGAATNVDFLMGDAERLSALVPRVSVDYVIDIESFYCYPNKRKYLAEVSSVMKDDATFFLAFFLSAN